MRICEFFKIERWFTFGEVLERCHPPIQEADVAILLPYKNYKQLSEFGDFLQTERMTYFTKTDTTEKNIVNSLLTEIYARFYDHYVFGTKEQIVENGAYTNEFNDKLNLLRSRFTSIFVETSDRYMNLLKIYKNELSALLDKVKTKSSGVGKFNDTPQNEIVNGDEFGDGGHISNITKSENETETDFDTKMGRIDEIQRKLKNILREWTDEFSGLFIESENF